ncbi:hypothetical protein I3760_05G196600 [Carya illinoinensis]|nr:hypothetical protein I3760_05G196600 [Carya illinoinensis]
MRIYQRSSLSIFSCLIFCKSFQFLFTHNTSRTILYTPNSISSNPTYPRLPHPSLSPSISLLSPNSAFCTPRSVSSKAFSLLSSLSSSLSTSQKYEMVKLSYITFFVGLSM